MRTGVVGAGVMGLGVAQCLAAAGHDVVVVEPDARVRAGAPARLRDGLRPHALLHGGRGVAGARGAVGWTGRVEDLARAEFVVECAPGRLPVKERLFADLDRACPPGAVPASCTSAIPIGVLAAATGRPGAVIGTHFMNPAPLKPTVEVVRSACTSDATLARTLDLLASLGKAAVVVGDARLRDQPGAHADSQPGHHRAARGHRRRHGGRHHLRDLLRPRDGPAAHRRPHRPRHRLDSLAVLRRLLDAPVHDPCPLLVDLVPLAGSAARAARASTPGPRPGG